MRETGSGGLAWNCNVPTCRTRDHGDQKADSKKALCSSQHENLVYIEQIKTISAFQHSTKSALSNSPFGDSLLSLLFQQPPKTSESSGLLILPGLISVL